MMGHHEWLKVGTRTSFNDRPISLLSARLRPLVPDRERLSHFWMLRTALKPGGLALEPSVMYLLGGPYRRAARRRDPMKDQKASR
jgi:hypothetical protein